MKRQYKTEISIFWDILILKKKISQQGVNYFHFLISGRTAIPKLHLIMIFWIYLFIFLEYSSNCPLSLQPARADELAEYCFV